MEKGAGMRDALTNWSRGALWWLRDLLIRFACTAEGEPLSWRVAWWLAAVAIIGLLAGGAAAFSPGLLLLALWLMLAVTFYDQWLMRELQVQLMPVMSRVATLVVSILAGVAVLCIVQWVL